MIIALFAIDQKNGMGCNGVMPWPRNREDMKWFKSVTEGQLVVMGRKTWDSKDMPVPLPNRVNVLVTNTFIDRSDIVQFRGDVPAGLMALQEKNPAVDIFVIGGPDILMQASSIIERAYITRIPGEYVSDATIDLERFLNGFKLINSNNLETCKIEEYEAVSRST